MWVLTKGGLVSVHLLEACRAVPLELFSPDGTCSTADELVRWRRCISADGKRPAEALPREGRAQEFDWARTELPPIDMGQVGAAAAAAGALRSCAGARLREGARGGGQRTTALWPAKLRAEPRPDFVPLPAGTPRELELVGGLPARVQLRRSPAKAAVGAVATPRWQQRP